MAIINESNKMDQNGLFPFAFQNHLLSIDVDKPSYRDSVYGGQRNGQSGSLEMNPALEDWRVRYLRKYIRYISMFYCLLCR